MKSPILIFISLQIFDRYNLISQNIQIDVKYKGKKIVYNVRTERLLNREKM